MPYPITLSATLGHLCCRDISLSNDVFNNPNPICLLSYLITLFNALSNNPNPICYSRPSLVRRQRGSRTCKPTSPSWPKTTPSVRCRSPSQIYQSNLTAPCQISQSNLGRKTRQQYHQSTLTCCCCCCCCSCSILLPQLNKLIVWWDSLTMIEKRSASNKEMLVHSAELAIQSQVLGFTNSDSSSSSDDKEEKDEKEK